MMTGRTTNRWVRCYIDGYDLSGYSRTIGPLMWEFEEADLTANMGDAMKGYLPGQPSISCGTLNGVFDNTATSGIHAVASSIQSERVVMVPIGNLAAPAAGDPVFCGQFVQDNYMAEPDGAAVVAMVKFGMWEAASLTSYWQPWGHLLHAKGAETAVNSDTADHDYGAQTTAGGYMIYHVFAGDGDANIKVQHADTNEDGSFADLGGCATGDIDCSSVQSGIIETTAKTTTVERYLRWQIDLTGGATTVTFALAFVRGR
jgi:hypothetical protein